MRDFLSGAYTFKGTIVTYGRARGIAARGDTATRRVRGPGHALRGRAYAEPAVPTGARHDPEAKHYNLYEFLPEKREALDRWAAEIAALIEERANAANL